VELIEGNESALGDIDRALAADQGLAPAESSKLQSALRAVAAAEPRRGRRGSAVLPTVDDDDPSTSGQAAGIPPIGKIVEAVLAELDAAPAASDIEPPPSVTAIDGAARAQAAGIADVVVGAQPAPVGAAAGASPDAAPGPGAPARKPARPRSRARTKPSTAAEPGEAHADDERPHLIVGKTPGVLADD